MKQIAFALAILSSGFIFAQDEVINPLLTNPSIYNDVRQTKASQLNELDSTVVSFEFTPLDLKYVWDDFSVNRFESYELDSLNEVGTTSELYYHLLDETNTTPQDGALIFCDSIYAHHDTVKVDAVGVLIETVSSYPFTAYDVWVNDLDFYPVVGSVKTVFQECYVLVDSIINGVLEPVQDTIWYNGTDGPAYVQDSARVFLKVETDTNSLWIDNYACRNLTFAKNPWSLGVATFDGVNENGMPYQFGGGTSHGIADYLTSREIDVSSIFGSGDNLYLTFIYQMKGNGNLPEGNDSLLVDFWSYDTESWVTLSSWQGLPDSLSPDQWDTARIAVPVGLYDEPGEKIQFRIKNYASLSGALDHWHIDYLSLETDFTPIIASFSDMAYSEPVRTILKDYTAVPWDHYKGNTVGNEHVLDDLQMLVHHAIPAALIASDFTSAEWSVRYNDVLQGGSPFLIPDESSPSSNFDAAVTTVCTFDGASDYFFDPAIGGDQASFDVEFNFKSSAGTDRNVTKINDTTRFTQSFKNYYAYDDGSAEAAYGIEGVGSLMAYKFEAYESDYLQGILMHFVPSVVDVSDEVFLLTVWADGGGQPGEIIYQDDFFQSHSPEYSGSKDGFRFYEFFNPEFVASPGDSILVPEVFYVGWQNIASQSMNIGLDWNIDNGDKVFRNTTGEWLTSSFEMSLLMRPVFSTALDGTLSSPRILTDDVVEFNLFPNPASYNFTITGLTDNFVINVYDLSGRQVISEDQDATIDISFLENGVYLVDVRNESGENIYTSKLIKK